MNEKTEKTQPRKFDALLGDLDDGGVVAKIDEELPTLIRKTLEVARSKGQAGKSTGTLSLKLEFKVDANGEVEIRASHTITTPTMPRALNRRWINSLTMEIVDANPKQTGFPFKEAPAPTAELRSV